MPISSESFKLVVGIGQVGGDTVLVGLHGLLAWPPSSGANLSVFVGELEGLDKSESLVHISADGEIVDCDLADLAFGINYEEAAESDSFVLLKWKRVKMN